MPGLKRIGGVAVAITLLHFRKVTQNVQVDNIVRKHNANFIPDDGDQQLRNREMG